MTRASISELKARLSRYLREVRRGGEVEILDRGKPIARLTRLRHTDASDDGRRERLVSAGVLRRGTGNLRDAVEPPPLEVAARFGIVVQDKVLLELESATPPTATRAPMMARGDTFSL